MEQKTQKKTTMRSIENKKMARKKHQQKKDEKMKIM